MPLEIGPPFSPASHCDVVPGQDSWNGSFI